MPSRATHSGACGIPTIEVLSLGEPPPAATVVEEKKAEARAVLGVGEAPPELASLLQALRSKLSSGTYDIRRVLLVTKCPLLIARSQLGDI